MSRARTPERFVVDRRRSLEVASREVGTAEAPPHSNRTKYGEWFQWNGVAWCAIFTSWVLRHSGGWMPRLSNAQGAAWVQGIYEHAKKTEQWRPRNSGYIPKPGDLVLFRFTNRADHIAFVISRLADGRDWTVEGNTNAGGSRTGGSVQTLYRRTAVIGYVACDETQESINWGNLRRYLAGWLLPQVQRLPALHDRVGPDAKKKVITLQKALNLIADAKLIEDGLYGPTTKAAVDRWQRTLRKLGAEVADPPGHFGNDTKWYLAIALQRAKDGIA